MTNCSSGHRLEGRNLYVWHGRKYCNACAAVRARIRRILGPRKSVLKKCALEECQEQVLSGIHGKMYHSDKCRERQNHRDYLKRRPGYAAISQRRWRKNNPDAWKKFVSRKISQDPNWLEKNRIKRKLARMAA